MKHLMILHRLCLSLSALLLFSSPLLAQTRDSSRFYIDVGGHALFPHASASSGEINELSPGLNTGAGLTAAFGTLVGRGFSTELEWGYQRAGVGDPDENLLSTLDPSGIVDFGGPVPDPVAPFPLPFSLKIDGDIQAQSLMANLYYRHPSWRLSPYAGFGAGVFFYDAKIDTQLDIDLEGLFGDFPGGGDLGEGLPPLRTTLRQEERRFGFQLMTGLSFRLRPQVELRIGYRYRSGREGPINSDQLEGGIRFRF